MTVVTGVSGSGKSSLAFDTIYAEGQRRYVESLSAYARQFLERMDKPDVDEILGIAPAIAVRQKNSTRNPRSTVATQTEIYDYLRLLFARVGQTFCHVCEREVIKDSPESSADEILETLEDGTRFYVLFPIESFFNPGSNQTKPDRGFDEFSWTRFFEAFAKRRNASIFRDRKIINSKILTNTFVLVDRLKADKEDLAKIG